MSAGVVLLWIICILAAAYLVWYIFRKVHGLSSFAQCRGIFGVFRKLTSANKLLDRAKKLSAAGDVSALIDQRAEIYDAAKALADALKYPALSVGPDPKAADAQQIRRTGYHSQAVRVITRLKQVMANVGDLKTDLNRLITAAGETAKDFAKELDGIKLD